MHSVKVINNFLGEGLWVWPGSNIYLSTPSPIAEFEERWIIAKGPTTNKTVNIHHASADGIFIDPRTEKSLRAVSLPSLSMVFSGKLTRTVALHS
ncbi:hypothetical protein PSCICN_43740 [Pseudomonas cichorii]|nr:hypothetical protein PSCICN_43740 [Pseudomonas cichorii]